VGGSVSIQDLLDDGYKSVFIGTGAWRPKRLNIPGETFGNVQYAINYLNNPDVYALGDRVAVIGSGNAAMDVARTAIRHGSRYVTVFSRDEKVSASNEEFGYAQIDGVLFSLNKAPVRITDEGVVMCDTRRSEEGKIEKIEGTEKLFEADSILIAVSQIPQDKLINRDKDLKLNERGNLATNDAGQTTMPGVFASGDVVTGAKTVVHAVKYSKEIAEAMDRYMKSTD
jgi:glutamate synthase (NADPH/NADH) small chain